MDHYTMHTILIVIVLLFIIVIVCYNYTKQFKTKKTYCLSKNVKMDNNELKKVCIKSHVLLFRWHK